MATAHLRGGPCDGQVIEVPADGRGYWAPDRYWDRSPAEAYYARRPGHLYPVSFLHRWGGELIETFDSFTRELVPPRMRPTDHLIYDWDRAPKVDRGHGELWIPVDFADEPHPLRHLAEQIVDRLARMGTFETRDLEWTCRPTGDADLVRMRCEVVMEVAT